MVRPLPLYVLQILIGTKTLTVLVLTIVTPIASQTHIAVVGSRVEKLRGVIAGLCDISNTTFYPQELVFRGVSLIDSI